MRTSAAAAWSALALAAGSVAFQAYTATRPAPTPLPPLYDPMLSRRLAAAEKRVGELEMSREAIASELERLRNRPTGRQPSPSVDDLLAGDRLHRLEQQMRDICIQTNGRMCP